MVQSLVTAVRLSLSDVRPRYIVEEAASISFFGMLSFFPLVMVMILISVQIGAKALMWGRWVELLTDSVPVEVMQLLQVYYDRAQDLHSVGVFSLSFVSALWLSTFAFHVTLHALRRMGDRHKRGGVLQRTISLLMMFYAYGAAIVLVQLLTFGKWLLYQMEEIGLIESGSVLALLGLRWALVLAFSFGATLLVYVVADGRLRMWRRHIPGAAVFGFAWIAATQFLVLYFKAFSVRNLIFGAVGSFVVLMMWSFTLSFLLLFCARINVHFDRFREHGSANMDVV